MKRVLVCGGREYNDMGRVFWALDTVAMKCGGVSAVIHGGARGADALAASWAALRGVRDEHYPPDWVAHGKAAGPLRNQRMLDEGKPDAVVALPGGHGTADMVRRAEAAGIPIWRPYGV